MIDFVDTLIKQGCNQITVFDSSIGKDELIQKNLIRTQTWQECIKDADVVVFGAAHDDIRLIQIDNLAMLINKNALVFDGRRYFTKKEIDSLKKLGLKYLGVGRSFR